LDDLDRAFLAPLERGVLPPANQALALAADGKAAFAAADLHQAVGLPVTKRALHRVVDALVGVVARLAAQAFAPPANCKTVVAGARVNHAVVVDAAVRTLHGEPERNDRTAGNSKAIKSGSTHL